MHSAGKLFTQDLFHPVEVKCMSDNNETLPGACNKSQKVMILTIIYVTLNCYMRL